jgi:predicted dithiol-disulfide oxidoreductase (DUF899 family)
LRPAHLLLLHESFADDVIHGRLDEGCRNRLIIMPLAVAVVGDEVLVGIDVRSELPMYDPNSRTAFKSFLIVRRILFDRFEIVLEVFDPLKGSVHVSLPKTLTAEAPDDSPLEKGCVEMPRWANDDSFCPSCSMWIDGFNGIAPHVTQQTNFVIASRAPIDRLREWAEHRGWHRLRLLSDDGPAFARDIDAEDAEGNPDSIVVVFAKEGDRVRHVYTTHPILEDRGRD